MVDLTSDAGVKVSASTLDSGNAGGADIMNATLRTKEALSTVLAIENFRAGLAGAQFLDGREEDGSVGLATVALAAALKVISIERPEGTGLLRRSRRRQLRGG